MKQVALITGESRGIVGGIAEVLLNRVDLAINGMRRKQRSKMPWIN